MSIYAFANGVAEVAPPTTVDPSTRGDLMNCVRHPHAGGGTNLHGGVATGLQRLAQAPASHPVRRIFLVGERALKPAPRLLRALHFATAPHSALHLETT